MGRSYKVGITEADFAADVSCPDCGNVYGTGSFCVYLIQGGKHRILGQVADCCNNEEILVVFGSKSEANAKSSEVLSDIRRHGSPKHLTWIPAENDSFD